MPVSSFREAGVKPAAAERWGMLVPSERVLLLAVDLPLPSLRRRREALPFAVEDRIAVPIESVHVVLGAELAPGRYLAAIVDHAVMREWVAAADVAGLGRAPLVPDALALAVPLEGCWSVEVSDGRARVRCDDGTGFAAPADRLAALWAAGGRKRLLSAGEAPAGLPFEAVEEASAEPLPSIDLRQGRYARRQDRLPRAWRRIAITAAGGLAAHAAIAGADTLLLTRIAHQREAEARALLATAYPPAATSRDLLGDAAALMPAGGPPGAFLPLATRAAGALAGSGVTLDSLRYDDSSRRLVLDLRAGDTDALSRARHALGAAGLRVTGGSTRSAPDRARTEVVLNDTGA